MVFIVCGFASSFHDETLLLDVLSFIGCHHFVIRPTDYLLA
jgi:hypothetical protein